MFQRPPKLSKENYLNLEIADNTEPVTEISDWIDHLPNDQADEDGETWEDEDHTLDFSFQSFSISFF